MDSSFLFPALFDLTSLSHSTVYTPCRFFVPASFFFFVMVPSPSPLVWSSVCFFFIQLAPLPLAYFFPGVDSGPLQVFYVFFLSLFFSSAFSTEVSRLFLIRPCCPSLRRHLSSPRTLVEAFLFYWLPPVTPFSQFRLSPFKEIFLLPC